MRERMREEEEMRNKRMREKIKEEGGRKKRMRDGIRA